RSRDGRLLYPAFPYPNYTRVTREDADAMFAYLRTLAPVARPATPHRLRWPYSMQAALAVWRAMYFSPGAYEAESGKSAEWNRGAYLVKGLGHCSACHTPRNALGAEKQNAYLAGGFAEGWEAPALSSLSQAPTPWSENELYLYLRTGESRFHGVAAGPMAPV